MSARILVVSTTFIAVLLISGCQHIAPQPLNMNTLIKNQKERVLHVEPVLRYAEALTRKDAQQAAPFNLDDGVSLIEAQAIALWYNPSVRLARLDVEQSQAIMQVAGLWPDPDLGLGLGRKRVEEQVISESSSGTSIASAVKHSWVNQIDLSITIPISGRLRAQKALRATQYDSALRTAQEVQWHESQALQEAWVRWVMIVKNKALLSEHIGQLEELSMLTRTLAEAGELSPANARLFKIEQIRREAELARLEHSDKEAHTIILGRMGLLPDAPIRLIPELALPAVDTNVSALTVDATHPTLRRLLGSYEVSEKALRLELRKQYPDITLSPGFEDEEDESVINLNFGIPVPVWNANKEGIQLALQARDRARLEVENAFQNLVHSLEQLKWAYEGATSQWTHLNDKAAPLIDTQWAEAQALLEVGELDLMQLHGMVIQAFEIKSTLLSAYKEQLLAGIGILAVLEPERLTPPMSKEIKND